MQYTKIKASCIRAKDRLNRTFLVRPDIDLETLGCVICTGFHAEYEHAFLFHVHKTAYVPESWLDSFNTDFLSMRGRTLSDLGPSFRFTYDTGDNWEFECKVYKRPVDYASDEIAVIIDGAGTGIWEDNAWGFDRYLGGEIPPDTSEDLEDIDWYMPWNLDLDQVSDTDMFDLEDEQDRFNTLLPLDIDTYHEHNPVSSVPYDHTEEDSIWHTFHEYLDDYAPGPQEIRAIFDEFRRVCGVLKENGELPERFDDLEQTGADFSDLYFLIYDMPSQLFIEDNEEDIVSYVKELKSMFIFEREEYEELTDSLAVAYNQLKENKNAQKELDEWREKYPDSFNMYARQVHLYGQIRKLKDAEALLNKLDIMHMEINDENFRLFLSAAGFYRLKGSNRKADQLEEQIERYREQRAEDTDDEDDYDDDDDGFDEEDYDEEDFTDRHMSDMMRRIIISDADRIFRENMEKYRSGMTEETGQALLEAAARSFLLNRKYWISTKKNGDPRARRIDGRSYIVLYTDPKAAEKDGVSKPVMSSSSEMMMYSERQRKHTGYLIDPQPGSDGFIFREEALMDKLYDLMTVFTDQIIEERKLELQYIGIDDPDIDEDDIPF
ncbi:MAG: hypothetical protein IIZ57_13575 [Solobacterium sp.]|nr:hypothetical protein [Solobacterium sp.]